MNKTLFIFLSIYLVFSPFLYSQRDELNENKLIYALNKVKLVNQYLNKLIAIMKVLLLILIILKRNTFISDN